MLSDLKDNTFKISIPIITNEELEKFNNYLENNLDNIVNEISKHVSRDREIILLKKVIEKQSKEIEELKRYEEGFKLLSYSLDNYTSNDKIKAKIEEVEQWELYNMKIPKLSTLDERLGAKIGIKYVLQSLLEKE